MINMDCPTPTNGSTATFEIRELKTPVFECCTAIPEAYSSQIRSAVLDFCDSSKMAEGIDKQGFVHQTFKSMIEACRGNGEFWILTEGNEFLGYLLASIVNDVDGRLTYWVSQAWVRKDYRNTFHVKQCWERIRRRAKECLCSHVVIVAGRNQKAYKRLFNLKDYAVLLKEEI